MSETIDMNNPHVGDFEFTETVRTIPVKVSRVKRKVTRVTVDATTGLKVPEITEFKSRELKYVTIAQLKNLLGLT